MFDRLLKYISKLWPRKRQPARDIDRRLHHARGMRYGVVPKTVAEVHLLIDNITATLNKDLPDISGLDPKISDRHVPPSEWLVRFGEIEWPNSDHLFPAKPSHGQALREAKDSAFLTQIRNALNQHAYPASGLSIAFTALVASDDDGKANSDSIARETPGDVNERKDSDQNGDDTDQYEDKTSILHASILEKFTRIDLARLSFPQLVYQIKTARRRLFLQMPILLFVVLIFTVGLSFDVMIGSTLATNFNTTFDENELLAQSIADSQDSIQNSQKSDAGSPKTAGNPTAELPLASGRKQGHRAPGNAPNEMPGQTPKQSEPAAIPCLTEVDPDAPGKLKADADTPDCTLELKKWRHARSEQALAVEGQSLDRWATGQWFVAPLLPRGWNIASPGVLSAKDRPEIDRRYFHAWPFAILAALVNVILPALYGSLGAITGQVRSTYQRIKDNKLMPRHIKFIFTPTLLGLVSGATVGLFYSTTGTDGGVPASTQLHLTTSAYSFLAGFGAEGVFDTLDSLVRRIFNLDTPPKV